MSTSDHAVYCSVCGKKVSGVDPDRPADGLVVRAFVQCPECVEVEAITDASGDLTPDRFMRELVAVEVEELETIADNALACLTAADLVFRTRFPDRHRAWVARVRAGGLEDGGAGGSTPGGDRELGSV